MPIKLGTSDVTLRLGSAEVDAAYLGSVATYTGLHPEAKAWEEAVIANSGTVSSTTLAAVSDFCKSIDAAGIRDRFYRLNLFCGTGLNACLVPLYRGPSLAGAQYGNTADQNVGPFVTGDYTETGASGGLVSNGSKYLLTGFNIAGSGSPVSPNGHISTWCQTAPSTRRAAIGVRRDTAPAVVMTYDRNNANQIFGGYGNNYAFSSASVAAAPHHILMQRAALQEVYDNGAIVTTSAATAPGSFAVQMGVFCFTYNDGGSVFSVYDGRLGSYSSGLDLTASQALAYYSALNTFMVSLGRK